MPRLVLLEWDETQLRMLDARTMKGTARAEKTFVFELDDSAQSEDGESLASQIEQKIESTKVGKSDAIVCLSRSDCQLRDFAIPLAPVEEIPEMVRFQALRQFTGLGQDCAIDYIVLDQTTEHGIEVLAAAISREKIKEIAEIVQRAGLTLKRIVLRPFAAASLVSEKTSEPVLVIDRFANETDLTVFSNSKVLATRTVRLSDDLQSQQFANMLAGEIRRTLSAAKNQGVNENVEKVLLLDDEKAAGEVVGLVSKQVDLPVEIVDPFELANQKRNISKRPDDVASFSSLLGSLQQHLAEDPDKVGRIDFLNPRQRVEDKTQQKKYMRYAAIAALALVTLGAIAYVPIYMKSKKIQNLRTHLDELKDDDQRFKATMAQVKEIDDWKKGEVVWLDELRYISENLPPADRSIIDSLHFRFPARSANPSVTMTGRVKGSNTVADIENGIRNDSDIRDPKGKTVKPLSEDKLYDHEFDQTITIVKAKLDAIRSAEIEKREAKAATKSPDEGKPVAEGS